MAKNLLGSVGFVILLISLSLAVADSRTEPAPLYGSYIRVIDRSKQTFNGHLNANTRPSKQKENFFTVCKASGCIAYTPNLYAPNDAPKLIEYRWKTIRWELQADHLFNCNDGSKVKSILKEFILPTVNGNFTGERAIKISKPGCPGEGPGVYRVPFKLTPV